MKLSCTENSSSESCNLWREKCKPLDCIIVPSENLSAGHMLPNPTRNIVRLPSQVGVILSVCVASPRSPRPDFSSCAACAVTCAFEDRMAASPNGITLLSTGPNIKNNNSTFHRHSNMRDVLPVLICFWKYKKEGFFHCINDCLYTST